MKTLSQSITESFVNEASQPIPVAKDWDRMMKIVLKGDGEDKMAKSLKDKNKAIARYVAGVKLHQKKELEFKWDKFQGSFSVFADKAMELGATQEDIQSAFDATPEPKVYLEKMNALAGKNLQNRFVGDISRLVMKLGANIDYLKHNGYAITSAGKEAMQRNGRKWTIGYKTKLTIGDKWYLFVFDAITDEGDGPTSYVLAGNDSDIIFRDLAYKHVLGKRKFLAGLADAITTKLEEV